MSKTNLSTSSGRHYIVTDDDFSISQSRFEVCLIRFYDVASEHGARKRLVNIFWACVSAAFSMTIMLVSSTCKTIGSCSAELINTIAIILDILLIITSIILGLYLATNDFKKERDSLVKSTIEEMLLRSRSDKKETYDTLKI